MDKRVRVVTESGAPRTIDGKFAGGLPAPECRGKGGIWKRFSGVNGSLILLDGEATPRYFLGIHFHFESP